MGYFWLRNLLWDKYCYKTTKCVCYGKILEKNFIPFLERMGCDCNKMFSQWDGVQLHTADTVLEILNTPVHEYSELLVWLVFVYYCFCHHTLLALILVLIFCWGLP
jgi:hypothetical protein